MKPALHFLAAIAACLVLVVIAARLPGPASSPLVQPEGSESSKAPWSEESLQEALTVGTSSEKSDALTYVRDVLAVRMMHEVIELIDDPSSLPREGDTGWGFVGHQAATVVGDLAFAIDRISIEHKGRREYSFFDDAYLGGEALSKSGRLVEVRDNWRRWWQDHINR
ncbi:MAG: hypothetical protein H6815_01660 [Phycisphaeraceae bacterium]|nr:hypothetical protein [Phycisphaerales bacterium]MCB9859134.1 hypothetical protein [Phycisphaeraceae bacterium]